MLKLLLDLFNPIGADTVVFAVLFGVGVGWWMRSVRVRELLELRREKDCEELAECWESNFAPRLLSCMRRGNDCR